MCVIALSWIRNLLVLVNTPTPVFCLPWSNDSTANTVLHTQFEWLSYYQDALQWIMISLCFRLKPPIFKSWDVVT